MSFNNILDISEKCATVASAIFSAFADLVSAWAAYEASVAANVAATAAKSADAEAKTVARAYIADPQASVNVNKTRYTITIEFRNGGQTPAYNVTRRLEITTSNDDIEFRPSDENSMGNFYRRFPETEQTPTDDIYKNGSVKLSGSSDVITATKHIYVFAVVKYRDIFHECYTSAVFGEITKDIFVSHYQYATDNGKGKCKDYGDGYLPKSPFPN